MNYRTLGSAAVLQGRKSAKLRCTAAKLMMALLLWVGWVVVIILRQRRRRSDPFVAAALVDS